MTDLTGRRTRRRHPAIRARIATAGIGVSALFGLVGVFGAVQPTNDDTPPPSGDRSTIPSIVVVHPTTRPETGGADSESATSEPIELTANPVVRTVEAPSAAPVGRTNGSR